MSVLATDGTVAVEPEALANEQAIDHLKDAWKKIGIFFDYWKVEKPGQEPTWEFPVSMTLLWEAQDDIQDAAVDLGGNVLSHDG